jgi:hypothetical protein
MAVFLLLICYVLLRMRFNETRNMSIAIMLTLVWWSLGEAIMRITPDAGVALAADRIFVNIGSTYIGAVTLHFALVLTNHLKGMKDSSVYISIYIVPIFSSVIRAATNMVVIGVKLEYWGYTEIQSGLGSIMNGISIVLFFIITFYVLFTHLKDVEGKTKRAYRLLIASLMVPVAVGFTTDVVLPNLGFNIPEMAMTATILFAISLAVAIRNLEAFEIVPVKEKGRDGKDGKPKRSPFILPTGKIYYLDEHKPEASLRAFASLVYSGRRGLALVRMNPRKFRELTSLETTPVIWLSSQEAPGERTINPSAIPRLFTTINEFLTSAKDPVILIEGIETMIFTNNFREVMGFLSQMYERISVAEDIMIIPISKATVSEGEWALMTKHMDDLTPFLPK